MTNGPRTVRQITSTVLGQANRRGLVTAAVIIPLFAVMTMAGCAGKGPSAPPVVSAECQAHIDLTAQVQAQYNNSVTAVSYEDLPISSDLFNNQACVLARIDEESGDTLAYEVAIPESIIYYSDAIFVLNAKAGSELSHGPNCEEDVFCGDDFILAVGHSEEPGFETQFVFHLQGDRR